MIPTAEEFMIKCSHKNLSKQIDPIDLIEFAKLHVEAALRVASNLVDERLKDEPEIRAFLIDGSSVLKCYPLDQIK